LPSVGTIMPISGAPPWNSKPRRSGNTTFARCETSLWKEEWKKQDGLTSQLPSRRRT
jgi:hypothetical protein